jgi:hypothetical protein
MYRRRPVAVSRNRYAAAGLLILGLKAGIETTNWNVEELVLV